MRCNSLVQDVSITWKHVKNKQQHHSYQRKIMKVMSCSVTNYLTDLAYYDKRNYIAD